MKLISFLLRTSRIKLLSIIAAGVISGIGSTGLITLVNRALSDSRVWGVNWVWAFLALSVAVMALSVLAQGLVMRMSQGAICEFRVQLSRHILAVPLHHLEKLGSNRLLPSLTDDIVFLANALGTIPSLCINLTIIVACLAYLGWLSWTILLVVIAFIVLAVAGYWLISKLAMKSFRRSREDEEVLFKHFSALTKGVKEMKLHRERREAFLSEVLLPTAISYKNHNITGSILFTVAGTWGRLLLFVVISLLIFVFPNLTNTSIVTVAAASLVIIYMVGPLEGVILTIPMLGRAEIALKKLQELGLSLSALSSEGHVTRELTAGSVVKNVELAGVVHSYNRERRDTKFTLGPINLTLTPGELVFLVGSNGSGKTTLVKLLCGLYIPEAGTISLNDELITEENVDHYRQLFSALFGDFYLFESFLGMTRSDLDTRARDYLVRFHLDAKVQVHDGKLSTIAVSQGQRKRLALLSAYLEDRPFYIFDEWASDQDPLFKEVFYTELLPELISKGKAVLVVTHDEKFFHLADRIVKLNNGRISYDSAVAKQSHLQAI